MPRKGSISIHALRGEGDPSDFRIPPGSFIFQSTPSVGRATAKLFVIDFDSIAISIHALRGEGDEHPKKTYAQDFFISIHALRGEGDDNAPDDIQDTGISIHALRGEGDIVCFCVYSCKGISIHALRGEGDRSVLLISRRGQVISIHALRGEGDIQID